MEDKKHIVAVTAVIKNKLGDKILIAKRNNNEIMHPGKWTYPGGKLERGETLMDTLKREVLEEIGLEIEDFKKLLQDYSFTRPDGHHAVGFNFLVKAKGEDIKLCDDLDDYKWVDLEEMSNFDHIEGMEIAAKKSLQD